MNQPPSTESAYQPVDSTEPLSTVAKSTPPVPEHKSSCTAAGLIISCLCFGIAFAVGHDRYNNSLDGRHVDAYGVSQQWVSRIETAFAFLVKMFLAAAVAAAYTQQLWRSIRSRTIEVGTMDALMAAPTDLLSQLNPRAWLRAPGILLMGGVIWLIPLAAVVTPGSLTVIYSPASAVTNMQVSQLAYNHSTWASVGPLSSEFQFWSAAATVQRTGFAAATAGEIIGAAHSFDNQSYTLDFWAPAVQCTTANDTVRNMSQTFFEGNSGSGGYFAYFSWVEGNDHGIMSANSSVIDDGAWTSLDVTSTDAARIYVYSVMGGNVSYGNLANVTVCLLHNASYTVDFSTANGISLATANRTLGDPLRAWGQLADSHNTTARNAIYNSYAYQSVMDVFGKLLVGYAWAQNSGIETFYTSFQRTLPTFQELEQTQADLEVLFQNMTLSMFSNDNLLKNSSQAADIPVTVTTYPLTYQYLSRDLWIAYGAAIFVTLVAAIVGLYSAFASGTSYSSKFSTVVRVAKYTHLYSFLPENDDGSDPLPRPIEKARLGGLDRFSVAAGPRLQ